MTHQTTDDCSGRRRASGKFPIEGCAVSGATSAERRQDSPPPTTAIRNRIRKAPDVSDFNIDRLDGPPSVFAMRDAKREIERLRAVEEDHKNVLKAALYNEPGGIELVNRLTTYALRQRTER